jgi:hypothetical protein
MESEMDNKDWLNDYPSLGQVSKTNPFVVPDNYFDELHQRAVLRAIIDGVNDSAETGYTVPENYFNELSNNLQSRINIETAITDNSAGFAVPENYFEEMQASLQSRVNIEAALQNTNGDFTVPEDYFEDQHQQIISMIAVDEILNKQPQQGFTVPENYFDNLQSAIISKTTADKPAVKREVGIVRKMFTSGAFKYATAACLVLGIGGTLFLRQYESPKAQHERSYIHKALSKVSDEDIIDYLQTHMDAADTRSVMDGIDQVNTDGADAQELKDYLSTH